jgi:flagellar hook capping protein FlgD
MFAKRWLLALMLLLIASPVGAGGPLLIFDPATKTAYHYPPGDVNIYMDSGTNGILTNAQSDNLTTNAFTQWMNVPTAYFSAVNAGKIKLSGVVTDITAANAGQVISTEGHDAPNGGGIFVIYDTDGTICSNFFGFPPGVLGVASPEFSETGTPNLTESWVVLNGAAIDPGDTSPFPGANFGGVYTHEFGHSIGLAHTQVNGAILFFGENDGPQGCPSLSGTVPDLTQMETMYPFIDPTPGTGSGLQEATVEQLDDVAALSDLYPTAGWPTGSGTVSGKIFMPDGTTEVSGVNIIARNLSDPLGNATSAISGDHTQGALGADGSFTLHGLTPGAQYLVYVDALKNGAFSTTPTTTTFLEEYWNGTHESGNVDTDTTCSYVPITVGAGGTATANILLNVVPGVLTLGDDDAALVTLPNGFSFCGKRYHSVWVNSNGNITFGTGDTNPSPSATALRVGAPRICGLWDDLDPTAGGFIAASPVGQNFVIRFFEVPEFLFGGQNTFTITLRPNATYRVDYGGTSTFFDTMAGRSPGAGAPDPGPTDLTTAPQPLTASTVYELFSLGDDLTNAHLEYAPCGAVVGVPEDLTGGPNLFQSSPNPFRSESMLRFTLAQAGPVKLQVFDLAGRHVATLADKPLPAGSYSYPWFGKDDAGRDVAPGIYFYRLETPTLQETRKVVRVQ